MAGTMNHICLLIFSYQKSLKSNGYKEPSKEGLATLKHRRNLAVGAAWLWLTLSASAQAAPLPKGLADSYGAMAPRYLRCVSFKEGRAELDLVRTRENFLRLRNVQDVAFHELGGETLIELSERPVTTITPKFIPLIFPVGLEAWVEDWRIGGQYHDLKAFAGYNWSTLTLYDPAQITPVQLGDLVHNYPELMLRWGMLVAPYTRLYMEGRVIDATMLGDPGIAATYGGMRGAALTGATFLRFDDADHPDIPTDGSRAKLGWMVGPQALGNPGDFQRVEAYYQRYWPLSERTCLAFGAHGGVGLGDLPLAQTFRVGSADYTRGYAANRFVGNQFVATSLEVRHVLVSNLWNSGLSLHAAGFVDAGRSWNGRGGIPFPQDVRPAAGAYGGLSLGSWYVGRLEAAVGTEGMVVHIGTGLPFPW